MENTDSADQYAWTSWPARDRPQTLLLALPVCAAALAVVYLLSRDAAWTALGALLLAAGLREYFLPVRYVMDAEGISVRYLLWTRYRRWKDVKRTVAQKTGVFLSPFPHPTRLEGYRGVFVRFGGNREEALALVRKYSAHE